MTKQELLTKLAIECATWSEAIGICGRAGAESGLMREDWLAERERLINKPSWKDALECATHLEMACDGLWWFFDNNPRGISFLYILNNQDSFQVASKAIAIPAGYDWKKSLEERPA